MDAHAAMRAHKPATGGARPGLLQRKCACGTCAPGGECMSCRRKRIQARHRIGGRDDALEREADAMAARVMSPAASASPSRTRHIASHNGGAACADGLWNGAGHALDAATRHFMEPRFAHDFSGVRVHTDHAAAASAQALGALAYATGDDVVFAGGSYRPDTPQGRHLIAHELAHVVQQRTGLDQSGTLRRKGVTFGGFLGNLFHFWAYSTETLQAYLHVLDQTGDIEDDDDSDDKARQIVKEWKVGGSPYVITEQRKALLIREMQSGFTGDDDELAILELLERSYNFELSYIFGTGGVTVAALDSDFHGEEWDRLKDFYNRRFEHGYEGALKGQLEPIGTPATPGMAMPVLGSWMPGDDIPGGVTSWNVPCVLGILCSQDRQVVTQLPKLTVQKADTITEYYWEFDGTRWNERTRSRGAAHNAAQNVMILKSNKDCARVATDIIHETRHHNQPAGLSPVDVEVDAYTFEEQWTIDRGLPGRPSFRSTTPGTRQEQPDKARIEAYVKSRYSGAAGGAPSDWLVGHLPSGEAKIERPDGSTYTRPAHKGESHQDFAKTKAGLSNLPTVDPKEWVCPGKP